MIDALQVLKDTLRFRVTYQEKTLRRISGYYYETKTKFFKTPEGAVDFAKTLPSDSHVAIRVGSRKVLHRVKVGEIL